MNNVVSSQFYRCLFLLVLSFSSYPLHAEQFQIQVGDTVSENVPGPGAGRIDSSTETDVYTFPGAAGQNVFFETVSVASTFGGWLRWDVKAPSGATVLNTLIDSHQQGRKTLPETGVYTVKFSVANSNPAYVGTYSFHLRPVPKDAVFSIQLGDLISEGVPSEGAGRIEVPGARDLYTFSAHAGDLAFIEEISAAADFKGWLFWELDSPSKQVIGSSFFDHHNELRQVLPEDGTYTLQVYARATELSYVGNYSLRIRAVPPDQSFALQVGQTVSDGVPAAGAGRIEVVGAQDLYTFNGTSGQSLFFDSMSADPAFAGWLQWQAKTPSGQSLFSAFFGGNPVGRKTLSETGTYTIRVLAGATSVAYVGPYSFRISGTGGDTTFPIQVGQTVSADVPDAGAGRIEVPGAQDTYTFSGRTGQTVVFDPLSAAASFGGWLRWQVKTPSGAELFTDFFKPESSFWRQLPEEGKYTLRVFVSATDPQYVGEYSFRLFSQVVANADSFATPPGRMLSMPKTKFLCNDVYDAGETVHVLLQSSASEQGGTLTVSADAIHYTPKAGFIGLDQFEYVLQGSLGGESHSSATVRVFDGVDRHPTVVSVFGTSPGHVRVCLLGAASQQCEVEQSTDLATWTPVESLTADDAGSMNYDYPLTLSAAHFYRFRTP